MEPLSPIAHQIYIYRERERGYTYCTQTVLHALKKLTKIVVCV